MKKITINFDLDGCLVGLYDVPNWLDYLVNEDTTPYEIAEPLLRLSALARRLNALQRNGYRLAIISWLSKCGSDDYNERVTQVKTEWLASHLPSVNWDEIKIVPYGTPKHEVAEDCGFLFDDEIGNRDAWDMSSNGLAFDACEIMEMLKIL